MRSHSYSTKEAKNQLNQIINHVLETKETVWITKSKKPVVKIVPIQKKVRQLGLLEGENFWISPDFDEADAEIDHLFYGE